jgi:protease I
MAGQLDGKRIAVFTAPEGVEQVELTTPVERLTDAGAMLELVSYGSEQVQMMNHLDKGGSSRWTSSSTRPTPIATTD